MKNVVSTSAFALSIFLHAGVVLAMNHLQTHDNDFKRREPLSVEIIETPAEVEEIPPEPLAAAQPVVPTPNTPKPAVQVPQPKSEEPTPPPAAQEVVEDFTGVTLTNENADSSWSSAAGNGASSDKPLGPIGKNTGKSKEGTIGGAVGGTEKDAVRTVGAGDLSERPTPPDLDKKLEQFYPPNAKRQGIEGYAVLKARINPDGSVSNITVVSESGPGFGAGCKSTLKGSIWGPPRDKQGRPVAHWIPYRCEFQMRY